MATIDIKAPDGKTLSVKIPEGTDPSQYDTIVENAVGHYAGTQASQKKSFSEQIPEIAKQAGEAVLASSPANLTQKFMETDPATMQKVGGPALPIVGGLLGNVPGAMAGEQLRQFTGTAFAPETVPETSLGRSASVLGAGVMQSPKMLNAIPGVPKVADMVARMVAKTVSKTSKGMAKVAQAFSGGKAQDFIETAQKGAKTYTAPSLEEAGKQFGRAVDNLPPEAHFIPPEITAPAKAVYGNEAKPLLDEFGQVLKKPEPPLPKWKGPVKTVPTMSEVIDSAVTPESSLGNKFLKEIGEKVDSGELITARQALKAKQSLDDVIDTVPIWQIKRRAKLFDLKKTFDDVLSSQSGELKDASNTYRAAVLKDHMTKFLPVNKHGDYSRLAPMLTGLASSVGGTVGGMEGGKKYGALGALTPLAGMVALSPGVLGGAAAGIGGATRGLNAIASNPQARQVLLQLLQRLQQNKGTP